MMIMFIIILILILIGIYVNKLNNFRPRKIMLLSLSRCNGTIILRFFGQKSKTQIVNEKLTRMNEETKAVEYSNDDIRFEKINELDGIAECSFYYNGNSTFITHEMAYDFTMNELIHMTDKLKWKIIIIIRDPAKQYASLLDLKDHGANEELRLNVLNIGWMNLEYYTKYLPIVGIIDGTLWCNNISYRKKVCETINIKYSHKYERLSRYFGNKFHDICQIEHDQKHNKWNNKTVTTSNAKVDIS
jgi:hypothetical protein